MSATTSAPEGTLLTPPCAVLFDLDGTLLDTAPDLIHAVNATLVEHGFARRPVAQLRAFVGAGGTRMLAEGIGGPDTNAAFMQAQTLVPRFLGHYARSIGSALAWFDGMEDVLQLLDTHRVPWGVVTNKPHRFAELTLYAAPALSGCEVLIGAGVAAHAKPAPHPIRLAATQLGQPLSQSWYVGDDERDMISARAAGTVAIAAGWGYIPPDTTPAAWAADAIAETPQALADLLRRSFAAAPMPGAERAPTGRLRAGEVHEND